MTRTSLCPRCDGSGSIVDQTCHLCGGIGVKYAGLWQPISTVPTRSLKLVRGASHNVHYPVFVVSAYYDPQWRPLDPWRLPNGNALSDFGWEPQQWTDIQRLINPPAEEPNV